MDDTTLVPGFVRPRSGYEKFPVDRAAAGGDNRVYGKFCQDTMTSGHKDSKNRRLTIPLKAAHTIRHANLNNRNVGDKTKHMGEKAYIDRRKPRVRVDNYGGSCERMGPTEDVVMRLDPSTEINGVTVDAFQHGGTRVDAVRSTMMGAGATVPVDSLDGTNLNNAYGLHYAIDISPGKTIGDMQKKNVMQDIAKQ